MAVALPWSSGLIEAANKAVTSSPSLVGGLKGGAAPKLAAVGEGRSFMADSPDMRGLGDVADDGGLVGDVEIGSLMASFCRRSRRLLALRE
jgi:hypothetical protein